MSLSVSIQIPGRSHLSGTVSISGPVSVAEGNRTETHGTNSPSSTSVLCTLWRRDERMTIEHQSKSQQNFEMLEPSLGKIKLCFGIRESRRRKA
ncbi:hypothetical protein J1605_009877 [Eschrichtius robustus]|uniref:Uncharacterized protein n=1 Tax=Eschrichtius robustus TaxID=9764 RepID=A0AB34GVZ2_ESCRO|nr:hypothetical protein J1605_009877 [Eschrichtius robustus]